MAQGDIIPILVFVGVGRDRGGWGMITGGETGRWTVSPPNSSVLVSFPNLISIKSFSNS